MAIYIMVENLVTIMVR